jgi:NCS1 family nucleobase:cation symporter-1
VAIIFGKVPPTHAMVGGFSAVAFAGQFAASASFNITYAPSVSDYSRYLPRKTSRASIIAAVYRWRLAAAECALLCRHLLTDFR